MLSLNCFTLPEILNIKSDMCLVVMCVLGPRFSMNLKPCPDWDTKLTDCSTTLYPDCCEILKVQPRDMAETLGRLGDLVSDLSQIQKQRHEKSLDYPEIFLK